MKKILGITMVVIATVSAIAFLKNVQYQEEKRQAGIAIAKDRTACQLKAAAEGEVEIAKYLAEKSSENKTSYEEKKKLLAEAEHSCKKVSDYEARYGSP